MLSSSSNPPPVDPTQIFLKYEAKDKCVIFTDPSSLIECELAAPALDDCDLKTIYTAEQIHTILRLPCYRTARPVKEIVDFVNSVQEKLKRQDLTEVERAAVERDQCVIFYHAKHQDFVCYIIESDQPYPVRVFRVLKEKKSREKKEEEKNAVSVPRIKTGTVTDLQLRLDARVLELLEVEQSAPVAAAAAASPRVRYSLFVTDLNLAGINSQTDEVAQPALSSSPGRDSLLQSASRTPRSPSASVTKTPRFGFGTLSRSSSITSEKLPAQNLQINLASLGAEKDSIMGLLKSEFHATEDKAIMQLEDVAIAGQGDAKTVCNVKLKIRNFQEDVVYRQYSLIPALATAICVNAYAEYDQAKLKALIYHVQHAANTLGRNTFLLLFNQHSGSQKTSADVLKNLSLAIYTISAYNVADEVKSCFLQIARDLAAKKIAMEGDAIKAGLSSIEQKYKQKRLQPSS